MATSERLLTAVSPPVSDPVLGSDHIFASARNGVWRQCILDFVTIAIGLTLTPPAVGLSLGAIHAPLFAAVVVAAMVTTLFAFAGAYPQRHTPLDIADTEGLVRGISCVVLLSVIYCVGCHSPFSIRDLLTGCTLLTLLIAQRELVHMFGRRYMEQPVRPVPLHMALRVSAHQPQESLLRAAYSREPWLSRDFGKRVFDIFIATIMLFLLLPLCAAVALLIKLDSRGPVFIRQRRVGRCGVPFHIWKFRSMHVGVARYACSPVSDEDPRLTRLGRSLRRFSIDELPQLLNVLKGEMSLVGPRPEMPFIVKRYQPHERLRLNAVPGITGLWQISPARALPIHHNLALDLFYIEHRNIFLDVALLLRTMTAVVRGIGAT